MARYRSYYRRRRYYRPRRYLRRRYRRARTRVANASSRSRLRIKVHTCGQNQFSFADDESVSSEFTMFHPFFGINDAVSNAISKRILNRSTCQETAFKKFAEVYDEVKCEFFSVKIVGIDPIGNDPKRVTFRSCWDRHSSRQDIRYIPLYDMTANNKYRTAISSSPSTVSVTCINNSLAKFLRFIRPSDLAEKINFGPTRMFTNSNVQFNYGANGWNVGADGLEDWFASATTPVPQFCPALVMLAERDAEEEASLYNYQYDITAVYTFRGPRFGQSSASVSKGAVAEDPPAPVPAQDSRIRPPAAAAAAADAMDDDVDINDYDVGPDDAMDIVTPDELQAALLTESQEEYRKFMNKLDRPSDKMSTPHGGKRSRMTNGAIRIHHPDGSVSVQPRSIPVVNKKTATPLATKVANACRLGVPLAQMAAAGAGAAGFGVPAAVGEALNGARDLCDAVEDLVEHEDL